MLTSSAVSGAVVGVVNGRFDAATGAARDHATFVDVPNVAVEFVPALEPILAVVLAANLGARISWWISTMDAEGVSFQLAPYPGFVFATLLQTGVINALIVMRAFMVIQSARTINESWHTAASFPSGPMSGIT